ncbi:MAG: excinuclease ABC subunit UvrA, partial [Muribaculaceae bacterium]|nr:excinuclease ABC subunit UvrA [Muribaculaceae bacterium]
MKFNGQDIESVEVLGARVHNLKNIDVEIPHYRLTVVTGLSGSGKSSLAFDTVFAEGQRRYLETFSSYARNMMGMLERPNVDKISGLCPVISIGQKTVNRNPRSTVGTTTEVYDYLRLLYARAADAYSYLSGERMVKYTVDKILSLILERYHGRRIYILAPLVKNRKGHYKDLFENLRKKGYINVRVDGVLKEITFGMKLDRYVNHSVELVVDRLKVADKDYKRLADTADVAFKQGNGQLMILDAESGEVGYYSRSLMDPATGLSYLEPAPHNFSFNSPLGACPRCKGLGYVNLIDRDKIMPDMSLSIRAGGILPLGKYKNVQIFWQISAICEKYGCTLDTPLSELPEEALGDILNGTNERLSLRTETMSTSNYFLTFDGLVKYIEMQQDETATSQAQKWAGQFFSRATCPECEGARLNREALHFRLNGKNIAELAAMDISELRDWIRDLENHVTPVQWEIAREIVKEIASRLDFLLEVGLDYMSLNRNSASLSGGESQRIRLATQIGSRLVNVLYILDEPSIGLHQRDNQRLIDSLKTLRDDGNTILVVEHDKEMMLQADYVIDIGPLAGRKGGNVVFAGTPQQLLQQHTLTADYLNGTRSIELPAVRRQGNGKRLRLTGCRGNNLKGVDVEFPLGTFICVTGVSGSGKSTLVNATLQPILSQRLYRSLTAPMPYDSVQGLEYVDKVVTVDQAPLGRTPRSNAATYTGVFTDIRNLFVNLPESKIRA